MDLKGKWSTLQRWQQYRLIHYACTKEWKAYWYYKMVFLNMNEKKKD